MHKQCTCSLAHELISTLLAVPGYWWPSVHSTAPASCQPSISVSLACIERPVIGLKAIEQSSQGHKAQCPSQPIQPWAGKLLEPSLVQRSLLPEAEQFELHNNSC